MLMNVLVAHVPEVVYNNRASITLHYLHLHSIHWLGFSDFQFHSAFDIFESFFGGRDPFFDFRSRGKVLIKIVT